MLDFSADVMGGRTAAPVCALAALPGRGWAEEASACACSRSTHSGTMFFVDSGNFVIRSIR